MSKDTVIHEMNSHDKLEAICIDVWMNGIHFKNVGIYNPPNNLPDLERIAGISMHRNTIILGDFNPTQIDGVTLTHVQLVKLLKNHCSPGPRRKISYNDSRKYKQRGLLTFQRAIYTGMINKIINLDNRVYHQRGDISHWFYQWVVGGK
ncbi:hypothetical protein TNIN_52601 [Trichonephila inaurata madagascariensis]|uniref:Endonuclease/exonuclease/phosphatase domain-containing protein n=1 Tax=Trichonephila inaurata madagascariensis TaxID=2747483 RepID=A0A8X7C5T1_9ARAC|nr:hypothetical protein TNIN_52601 [Trichonephila inaurata madagascariensis]